MPVVKSEPDAAEGEYDPAPMYLNIAHMHEQSCMKVLHILYYVFVFVCLGVPIWHSTTGSYQATLPYTHMMAVSTHPIKLTVQVNLQHHNPLSESLTNDVLAVLQSTLSTIHMNRVTVHIQYTTSDIHTQLRDKFSDWLNAGSTVQAANDLFGAGPVSARISLHLDCVITAQPNVDSQSVYWTQSQLLLVWGLDHQSVAQSLQQAIADVFLDQAQLTLLSERLHDEPIRALPSEHKSIGMSFGQVTEQHRIWSTVPAARVVLDSFVLLADQKHWVGCAAQLTNITHTMRTVVGRVSSRVQSVTQIQFSTQRLHDVRIANELLSAHQIDDVKHYVVDEAQLPLLINPLEKYLSSIEQTAPVYRVLVYVPPSDQRPLHIQATQSKLLSHSFVVADWGGLVIVNPTVSERSDCPESSASLLESVCEHVRYMIGLHSLVWPKTHVRAPITAQHLVTDWELTRLATRQLVHNLLVASHTLGSLEHLLSNITTINIKPHIATEISTAVSALQSAFDCLDNAPSSSSPSSSAVFCALPYSQTALARSEAAFFDESLLALLYFPQDQKYAIYVPLFLPVGIPILISFVCLIKNYAQAQRLESKLKLKTQ